jgi:bifunctional DNase/RNase
LIIFVFYSNTLEEFVQLQIVSLSPSASGATSFILFLQTKKKKQLGFPMVIGMTEAQSISMFLEDIIPARPLTHDLFVNFIKQTNISISFIEVASFQDGVFYAKIHGISHGESFVMDARPSDSIALAIRLEVDILISESLLNEIAVPIDLIESDEPLNDLESVTPSELIADLELSLNKAILEENYEEAARLRDQLNQLTK